MINLSKSKYCNFWQCPKMAWLNKYKPEEKTEDFGLDAVLTRGNEVGDLAEFSSQCAKRADELILQVDGLQKFIKSVH